MFVKFDAFGKVAELSATAPTHDKDFVEVEAITFENKDKARLTDGKVIFVDEATLKREQEINSADQELSHNLSALRSKIDLAQSVSELTKKVDIVIQMFHQLVLANKLRGALSLDDQKRYDNSVAVFAEAVNMMNVFDFDQSVLDIMAMHEKLVEEIKAYYVNKTEIYEKYNLTEKDVAI